MPRKPTTPIILDSADDVRRGVVALRRACPVLRAAHELTGDPPLRRHPSGFAGLARVIIGQQLSIASAAAIWGRVEQRFQPLEAKRILKAGDDELRGAGLSRPKVRTLRALSQAVAAREIDFAALERAPDAEVHAALTAVSGIGPWTADIYLLFCLGRADAWAAGDLALQIAAQEAFKLETRPTAAHMVDIAERWRPWRGVAAKLLWAYYAHNRARRDAEPLAADRVRDMRTDR